MVDARNGSLERVGKADVQVLLAELKECSRTGNLERGKQVHVEAVKCGHDSCIYIASALINMYAKCGCLEDAREVFECIKQPDVVSWNALILGYANNGQGLRALRLFTMMKREGLLPTPITFVAVLKACSSSALTGDVKECIQLGKAVENLAIEDGCNSNMYVQNTLIDMYAKCGSMVLARQVFDSMQHPDLVSWNALIVGYADQGQGLIALDMFTSMQNRGPAPDYVTFVAALKACTSVAVEENCRWVEIHNLAVKNGYASNIFVQNTLIDVYARTGSMMDARKIFEGIKHPDLVSWNVLILGYADNGEALTALDLFTRMRDQGPTPDPRTFVAALKACSFKLGSSECMIWGKKIHNLAVENYSYSDPFLLNTLIDMYAKCGSMIDARRVFDSVMHPELVSWNALIQGYADNGQDLAALDMFTLMKSGAHVPDFMTYVAAMKACTSLVVNEGLQGWKDRSKQIHNLAVENGCDSNVYVQTTLISLYAKCGNMVDAHRMFDSVKHPAVASVNALISGYADNGQGLTSLDLYMRMRSLGPSPNALTFASALKACALLGALQLGRSIHTEVLDSYELDVVLVTCLVDFYAKCGSLIEAQSVFDQHAESRNIKTWSSLLAGYSNCGDHESMFRVFEEMQDAGVQPNHVTFLSILTCCNHGGLVEKAKLCFDSMSTKYGIVPTMEHYNSMIDSFGRANMLDDAMALLHNMPCSTNDVTWMTILSACQKWKNLQLESLALESRNFGKCKVSLILNTVPKLS